MQKKTTLCILFMDGVQLSQGKEPLQGDSLLFTTKSPGILGTHFIDLWRMTGWVDLGATQWFWTWDPRFQQLYRKMSSVTSTFSNILQSLTEQLFLGTFLKNEKHLKKKTSFYLFSHHEHYYWGSFLLLYRQLSYWNDCTAN